MIGNSWRKHAGLLLVMAVVAPLMLTWSWTDQIGELGSDAPDYLIAARGYAAPVNGDPVDREFASTTRFPPLYPLLLALFHGGDHLLTAHLVTTCCLLAALLVLYHWLTGEGLSTAQSALIGLTLSMLPATWMMALRPQSEYPYLLLSLLVLLLLGRHRLSRHPNTLFMAALLVAAAALTRTIGVTLLGPLAMACLNTRRREGLIAIGLALVPLILWHSLHRDSVGYDTTLSFLLRKDPVAALTSNLPQLASALWSALRHSLVPDRIPSPLAALVPAACLVATIARLLRLRGDAVYLALYGAILLMWPYPEEMERLLWPALPVLLAQPFLLLHARTTGSSWPSEIFQGVVTLSSLLVALPALSLTSERYRCADEAGLSGARGYEAWYHPDLAHALNRLATEIGTEDALEAFAQEVPANDCVVATRPNFVTYLARRRAATPPLNSVPDPYFMRMLRESGCRYVFMYNVGNMQFPVVFHPMQRLPEPVRIVAKRQTAAPPPGDEVMYGLLARIE